MKDGVAACVGLLLFVAGVCAQNSVFIPRAVVKSEEKAPIHGYPVLAAKLGEPTLTAPTGSIRQEVGTQERNPSLTMGFQLHLAPPEPRELFRFETDEKVRQRFRNYLTDFPQVEFPPAPEAVPIVHPSPRRWAYLVATAEPAYVCYKRLWFEQTNSERYGWELGVLQPFISTGVFYTDLALLPLHWLTDPWRSYDCSAGQCLPGDRVPLLWNPVFSK
jgi:hypothetical protein